MLRRLGAAALLALLALLSGLPLRVPPATAAVVTMTAAQPAPGPIPGLTERFFAASQIRRGDPGRIRVVELSPAHPVADLIFMHGHADRPDNHRDLFQAWAASGIRVLAPDLPSHGLTTSTRIDAWDTADLLAITGTIDRTLGVPRRPLIVAGWSFGGLLVTRLLQEPALLGLLGRRPAAAILLAPAVVPLPFSGGDGISRLAALTHTPNPPVAGPPSPASPLLDPVFAVRLLASAMQAKESPLPRGIPVQVVVSDPAQDRYINAGAVRAWATGQRQADAAVSITVCDGARHAVDLEPWPIGPQVRAITVAFLGHLISGLTRGSASPIPSEGALGCRTL
jgi:pimeloyl-ACP methyl ester carboxylesterase